MKAATGFSIALVLLGLVCLFSSDVSATHDYSEQRSGWAGSLYGNAEIWGLGYSIPIASSTHYILVSNEGQWNGRYLYEFKASILETGTEVKSPVSPVEVEIHGGAPAVVKWETLHINLNAIPQIDPGELFTLDCYTRLRIHSKFNGTKEWVVDLRHRYMK